MLNDRISRKLSWQLLRHSLRFLKENCRGQVKIRQNTNYNPALPFLGKAPKARKIREQKVPKKKRHPDDSTSEEESASEEEENPEDNLSDRYLFPILKQKRFYKDSIDSIPSPATQVKIQIIGGKVCLRYTVVCKRIGMKSFSKF